MLVFFENGKPYAEITVRGILGGEQKIKGIIDTGFTGCVSIPFIDAFPLGLMLSSQVTTNYADNRKGKNFLCLGHAVIENVGIVISFTIKDEGDILFGTEFFKLLKRDLYIDFVNEKIIVEKIKDLSTLVKHNNIGDQLLPQEETSEKNKL